MKLFKQYTNSDNKQATNIWLDLFKSMGFDIDYVNGKYMVYSSINGEKITTLIEYKY